jgi:hypothetical protein
VSCWTNSNVTVASAPLKAAVGVRQSARLKAKMKAKVKFQSLLSMHRKKIWVYHPYYGYVIVERRDVGQRDGESTQEVLEQFDAEQTPPAYGVGGELNEMGGTGEFNDDVSDDESVASDVARHVNKKRRITRVVAKSMIVCLCC